MQTDIASPKPQRTSGHGRICVKHTAGCTRVDELYQEGAARIRIPDHPGRNDLEAVIINTAGGITGGDDLGWTAQAGTGTHLTVTTQACEKVYKADKSTAYVNVTINVADGATLQWLPQETILFDQARLHRSLTAHISGKGELLLVEPVIFGRKAMEETVRSGVWRDRWRIHHNGSLVHAEEVHLTGDVAQHLTSQAGLGGNTALATLVLVSNHSEAKLNPVRDLLGSVSHSMGGASCWTVAGTTKLVIRLIAVDGYALRKALIPLINLLASSSGAPTRAAVPKIWSL